MMDKIAVPDQLGSWVQSAETALCNIEPCK